MRILLDAEGTLEPELSLNMGMLGKKMKTTVTKALKVVVIRRKKNTCAQRAEGKYWHP